MYAVLGALLTIIGAFLYAVVFWRNSGEMEMPKRIIFISLSFPVMIYLIVVYAVSIVNGLNVSAMGISYLFAGLAFMCVNIGRSFVAAKIAGIMSKDKMAFAISEVHLVLFETNAIYTLLVFVLGMTAVRENAMGYSLMNTAVMYISLFAAMAAILMGIVMNRALEGVEDFKEMHTRFPKTIVMTISVHTVAIIGLILAIYTMLPYLGE